MITAEDIVYWAVSAAFMSVVLGQMVGSWQRRMAITPPHPPPHPPSALLPEAEFVRIVNRSREEMEELWLEQKVAERRSWEYLLEWLTSKQLEQWQQRNWFDVVGNVTGAVYTIEPPRSFNIVQWCHCGNYPFLRICVVPKRRLPPGDVLVTQKLGLELDEEETYRVANKSQNMPGPGTFDGMTDCCAPHCYIARGPDELPIQLFSSGARSRYVPRRQCQCWQTIRAYHREQAERAREEIAQRMVEELRQQLQPLGHRGGAHLT